MIVRHLNAERVSPNGSHHWVGYYDKQPWNAAGDRILAHRATFCDRVPSPNEACEIGTLRDGAFEPAGVSRAWNWQQGAQLRWSDLTGEESLMFNDSDEQGRLISRWVTPDGRERHRIPVAAYAVTPDGRTAVTLSFGRLSRLRPEYGYPGASDDHPSEPAPATDGVWAVDLASGHSTLLCSLADLARLAGGSGRTDLSAPDAPHQHVNHLMVNPSGTRCCFLHRYQRDDGILQSRLCTVGLDGGGLRLLMEGMVSHYDWRDDDHIVAWGGVRRLLGDGARRAGPSARAMSLARRTLKPIYYALGRPRLLMNKVVGDSYLVIPDHEGAEGSVLAKGQLTCDGHNTFLRTGTTAPRWMLTDGYPDLRSRQPLFLWDLHNDRGYEIGRFPTPRTLDGPVRVDLHPRFSRDGRRLCFDSALDGTRGVYAMDIGPILGEIGA